MQNLGRSIHISIPNLWDEPPAVQFFDPVDAMPMTGLFVPVVCTASLSIAQEVVD